MQYPYNNEVDFQQHNTLLNIPPHFGQFPLSMGTYTSNPQSSLMGLSEQEEDLSFNHQFPVITSENMLYHQMQYLKAMASLSSTDLATFPSNQLDSCYEQNSSVKILQPVPVAPVMPLVYKTLDQLHQSQQPQSFQICAPKCEPVSEAGGYNNILNSPYSVQTPQWANLNYFPTPNSSDYSSSGESINTYSPEQMREGCFAGLSYPQLQPPAIIHPDNINQPTNNFTGGFISDPNPIANVSLSSLSGNAGIASVPNQTIPVKKTQRTTKLAKKSLKSHQKVQENQILGHADIKYPCPHCPKIFPKTYGLKSHLVSHSNLKPFNCKFCRRGFARSHDCKRHEMLHLKNMKHTNGAILS
ncbi:hypothetical protein WICPIJ_000854 [Wickerhamomyces pijperi]|uniref:C2H2-type domain-containing protein n=1 Tax=Wickerhamomyces pijperi TaxID=599730 RepID=A0A9P8QFN5_WICPI|nr:hypothetical protein WICPIJ_000854 [Wickerhamomyces pijperi]